MKINKKIISIPPYISTTWANIAALHMKGPLLIANLIDGETIEIPSLSTEQIEVIFQAHTEVMEELEKEVENQQAQHIFPFQQLMSGNGEGESPFRFGIGTMDGFGAALQHNPEQMNAPDLPSEILEKVHSIAKIISPEDPAAIPKPEPHCNCIHCQIARAINSGLGKTDMYKQDEVIENEVTLDELSFQQWDIEQLDDKLYSVVNRIDPKECYNVFLGQPVGCTCGKKSCEHIVAVLKS